MNFLRRTCVADHVWRGLARYGPQRATATLPFGYSQVLKSRSRTARATPRHQTPDGRTILRLLTRLFQRLLVFCIGILSVWLIVFVVFDTADHRFPWIFAVCLTYGLAAYVILPNVVRLSLKVLHRGLIP